MSRLTNLHNEKINETFVLAATSDISLDTCAQRGHSIYNKSILFHYFAKIKEILFACIILIASHELQELFSNH